MQLRFSTITMVCAVSVVAHAYVPPSIDGHVTDQRHRLTAAQKKAFEQKLEDYRRCSQHEIAVFLPATLGDETIEDVAYGAFQTWHIGRAKEDDGVLLVIAAAERRTRIETGKGAGGEIPDLIAKKILAETVAPRLKGDDFFGAVEVGTSEIARRLGGCPITAAATYMDKAAPTAITPPAPAADAPLPWWHWLIAGVVALLSLLLALFPLGWQGTPLRLGMRWAGAFGVPSAIVCAIMGEPIWSPVAAVICGGVAFFIGLIHFMFTKDAKTYQGEAYTGSSSGDATTGAQSGSSSGGSDYSGGGGSSGGGGASDSY